MTLLKHRQSFVCANELLCTCILAAACSSLQQLTAAYVCIDIMRNVVQVKVYMYVYIVCMICIAYEYIVVHVGTYVYGGV